MLTTIHEEMADRLALFAAHGMEPRYYHQVVGINSRLDSFQAAALNVKMTHIDRWNRQRQKHARLYSELLTDAGLDKRVGLPRAMPGQNHVWNQYTIRVPDGERDAMRASLAEAKIGSEIYYPVPLHLQECFETLGYSTGSLPETERAATEVLCSTGLSGVDRVATEGGGQADLPLLQSPSAQRSLIGAGGTSILFCAAICACWESARREAPIEWPRRPGHNRWPSLWPIARACRILPVSPRHGRWPSAAKVLRRLRGSCHDESTERIA